MPIPIFQLDAFTNQPFAGNPAAVCLLEKATDEKWMQSVATEMNLSDTAFVSPGEDGFNLRWFTPRVEVDLCGHATLAAAQVLLETRGLKTSRFHTKSGLLTCVCRDNWIEMDFPADVATPVDPPVSLFESLGIAKAIAAKGKVDYLVQVESESQLRGLTPDFFRLKKIDTRGIIVTARSNGEFDFVSRFFAPAIGIDEDPVTGSAHCCLGPWWRQQIGKDQLLAYQASARGGVVRIAFKNDRVMLAGQAVTVLRGELVAPR